jgi:hypothetical protein
VNDVTRRQWNQVFFRQLHLTPEAITGAQLTDLYGDLLSERSHATSRNSALEPALFVTMVRTSVG